MALQSVLMTAILAFSLASTEQCGSSIDLSLHSMKNASGHWIITVDTRRLARKDDPREFSVNVQHDTRIRGRYEIEEHVLMAFVYPSLHDTSMPGANEPSTTRPTTTSSATPSTSITTTTTSTTTATPSTSKNTTATPSTSTTTTATTTTTITTITPKSCPHPGYQQYAGFNCYKAFPSRGESKNWREAREQCMGDGGDLMVIETERERKEVFIPLYNSLSWSYSYPRMRVYIPPGGNNWMSVKDEPARSTWWQPGGPWNRRADRKCAAADLIGLLWNYDCAETRNFICEISL